MRVIVSSTLTKGKYSKYNIVDSLQVVQRLNSDLEVLIFHTSTESEFKLGSTLATVLKKKIDCLIYINEAPNTLISTLIKGVNGQCFTDEFYFDDEEDLDALVDDVKNSIVSSSETALVTTSNASIIQDFLDSFARQDKRIQAPAYLEQVKQAVTDLNDQLDTYALATEDMSNKVLTVFTQVSDLVKKYDDLNNQFSVLTQKFKEGGFNNKAPSGLDGSITSFAQYPYYGSAKSVLFREVAPCRYLTTFAWGYYYYLKNVKNKRVKLIFLAPKFKLVADKYKDCTSITSENFKNDQLYFNDVLYVNHPVRDVMDKVFGKTLNDVRDVYIIVDRLYGTTPIFKGTSGTTRIYAASGVSDIKRFNLSLEDTLFSVTPVNGAFHTIPSYQGYPTEPFARQSLYSQNQKSVYEKIDKRIML